MARAAGAVAAATRSANAACSLSSQACRATMRPCSSSRLAADAAAASSAAAAIYQRKAGKMLDWLSETLIFSGDW